MSQNYPPHGGGRGRGQGRRQEPSFSREDREREYYRREALQDRRNTTEPERFYSRERRRDDFFAPQQEPVYQYGGRHFPTEQDATRQRDQRAASYSSQQPLVQPREGSNDFFGPHDRQFVRGRREPPPEQFSGYANRGNQPSISHPQQSSGYYSRGNLRGSPPPEQSSNSQHGGFPYHGSHQHNPPIRVPQAQSHPPSRASNHVLHGANAGGQPKDPNSKKRKRKHTSQTTMSTRTPASFNNSTQGIKPQDGGTNVGDGRQKSLHSGNKAGVNVDNFKSTKTMTEVSTKPTIPSHATETMRTRSSMEDLEVKKHGHQVFKALRAFVPGFALKLPENMAAEIDAEIAADRVIQEQKAVRRRSRMASGIAAAGTSHGETAPKEVDMDVCGNCRDRTHVVADCNKPQSDGLIHGCAICNAADHSTWGCQRLPRGDGKTLEQLNELVFKRANLPPLHGKYWYALMYPYMEAHPDTEVPGLPWTKEFSEPYHKSVMLQHKLRFEMDNNEEVTVDPKTRTWQAAVEHYGIPRQRGAKKTNNLR
ncbi:hypothetical protein ACHAO9_009900 [Fusarium lateritium]